jgi:hypothetical protein
MTAPSSQKINKLQLKHHPKRTMLPGPRVLIRRSGETQREVAHVALRVETSARIPARSASLSITMPSPVLPDPVIPTMTPCVVRSLESSVNRSAAPAFPVAGAKAVPRNNPVPVMSRVYSTLRFSIPGSGSGSLGSIRSSASTRSCATATDFTQLRSAGTTCQGAHSVDVSVSASS